MDALAELAKIEGVPIRRNGQDLVAYDPHDVPEHVRRRLNAAGVLVAQPGHHTSELFRAGSRGRVVLVRVNQKCAASDAPNQAGDAQASTDTAPPPRHATVTVDRALIARAREFLGGVDVAIGCETRAAKTLTPSESARGKHAWEGRALASLTGAEAEALASVVLVSYEVDELSEAILFVPPAAGTRWFDKLLDGASLCLLRGVEIAVFYVGARSGDFWRMFRSVGRVILRTEED